MNCVLEDIKIKDYRHSVDINDNLEEAYAALKSLQVSLQEAAYDLQKFAYHVKQLHEVNHG